MVNVNSNRITKNDVSKVFESPYDSKSFKVSDAISRLSRNKYAACIRNGMGAFTLFNLHEYSIDASGRSFRAQDERQCVILECKNGCTCNSVFESSEAVLLSMILLEGHILFERACQRRGDRGEVLYKKLRSNQQGLRKS